MKNYLFLFLIFNCIRLGTQNDNYSFTKLMAFNNENKIILVKWNGAWEVPEMRYSSPLTLSKIIDVLASEHGITVQNKKLSGFLHLNMIIVQI